MLMNYEVSAVVTILPQIPGYRHIAAALYIEEATVQKLPHIVLRDTKTNHPQ